MKNKTKDINSTLKQIWFLRSIIIVSIVAVVLLFAYSFLFLTPSYVHLIGKISEKEAIKIAHHIAGHFLPHKKEFTQNSLSDDFPKQIQAISNDFDLMKVKLYAPDGETIFSTSPEDIGVLNTKEYFHSFVKSGQPFTKIVQKNTKSLEDQTVAVDVVETYVPVMNGKTFLGAFEIYLDTTKTKTRLDQLVLTANLLLVAISSALLLTMIFIVLKAKSNILARQEAENKIIQQSISIQEKNHELSIINAVSDVINESIDLEKLLTDVLEKLAKQFGPENDIKCVISLLSGNTLQLATHFGYDEEFIKNHEQLIINECLCGRAANSVDVIIACGNCPTPSPAYCSESKERDHVIVPLITQKEVIGILSIRAANTIKIDEKMDMLYTIGNQLGLAISNTRLFMETKKHALIDSLTGLGNRRNMVAHITRFISEARRHKTNLTLVMADIDHFKRYNDTYGHAKGDEILTQIASILTNEVRDVDFVARYGGEEFLILFSKTDIYGAGLVCERIRATVEKDTDVTLSLGIAAFLPEIGENDLIEKADTALYRAKDMGRNRVEIAPS